MMRAVDSLVSLQDAYANPWKPPFDCVAEQANNANCRVVLFGTKQPEAVKIRFGAKRYQAYGFGIMTA